MVFFLIMFKNRKKFFELWSIAMVSKKWGRGPDGFKIDDFEIFISNLRFIKTPPDLGHLRVLFWYTFFWKWFMNIVVERGWMLSLWLTFVKKKVYNPVFIASY